MRDQPSLTVFCSAPVGMLHVDVRFTLSAAWTVLFGPSGSGKSSILRLAAGLWMPEGATVHLDRHDLTKTPPHLRRIGLVAQEPALFPHLDVQGNVRFGCTSDMESAGFVREIVDLLDLQPLQHARIAQLSGGERQRVALARALAAAPRLLLLDEVFTGMHRELRTGLLERVRTHCAQRGVPVLSVTHDVAEALACADEVLRMAGGRIVAQGPPREVLADERTALLRQLSLDATGARSTLEPWLRPLPARCGTLASRWR